ncbi:MAG: OmpA family protein [Bacteroidales bacterium]|nr:OmpA family protein [Bacteroidales bacterium]
MRYIRFIFFAFLISCLSFTALLAQSHIRIKKSEFKIKDDGFNTAWKSIKRGDKLFDQGKGTFRMARDNYLYAYSYNPNNAELNLKVGISYLYTDNKYEAIKYLQKAYTLKPDVTWDIHYLLGRAHHMVYEYDEAIEEYMKFQNDATLKELRDWDVNIGKLIKECETGKILMNTPVRVIISNLGEQVNSDGDDYCPVLTRDDDVLYFSSRRKNAKKDKRSPVDNKYYENVYASFQKNGQWSRAFRLDKPVNDEHNNSVVEISRDGKTMYLYNGFKNGGDILYTTKNKKAEWKKPKPVPKINSKYRESSMCLSANEKTIFFVSNRKKETFGGKDIFVTHKNYKGKWERPVNIGPNLNTEYDEECVALHPNDSILYFSSKGHDGMGGYDIFMSQMSEGGGWKDPVNIGYPINTSDDDIFYRVAKNGKYSYYSANRENSQGEKDIYRVTFLGEEKEMIMGTVDVLWAGIAYPAKSIFFEPPIPIKVDTTLLLKGKVLDSESQNPIVAKMEVIDNANNKVIATAVSGSDGAYKINLPEKKNYAIEILARGYLFFLEVMDLMSEPSNEVIEKNFLLESVEVGAKVVLKNIFFETGKSTLKSESYYELNNIIRFLQENPSLRLEISGHTDNVGSAKTNQKLSEARAKAVVDYLVANGIPASNLTYAGYGFDQPVAPNTTAEGRALNRRVEFKILSK